MFAKDEHILPHSAHPQWGFTITNARVSVKVDAQFHGYEFHQSGDLVIAGYSHFRYIIAIIGGYVKSYM